MLVSKAARPRCRPPPSGRSPTASTSERRRRVFTVLVERQECTDRFEAQFEDAIIDVLVASGDGDDKALPDVIAYLERLGPQKEQFEPRSDG